MEFDPFVRHASYRDMYAYDPDTRESYPYLECLLDAQRQTFALHTQLDITPTLHFLAGLQRADVAGNMKLYYRDFLREVIVASNLVSCRWTPSKQILRERVMVAKREGRLDVLLNEATWEIEESRFDAQYVAQATIRRIVSADAIYENLLLHAIILEMAFALRAEIVSWITGEPVVIPAPILTGKDEEKQREKKEEEASYYDETSASTPTALQPSPSNVRVHTSTPSPSPTNPLPIHISSQTKLLMRRLYTNCAQQKQRRQQRGQQNHMPVKVMPMYSLRAFHYFAFTFFVSCVILFL